MQYLKESCIDSSLTNVSLILKASRPVVKAVWSIILLICVGVFMALLAQSVIFFFQYPVGTTVSIGSGPLEFPAVSVCSLNPYKASTLMKKAPQVYKALSQYSEMVIAREKDGQSSGKPEKKQNDTSIAADTDRANARNKRAITSGGIITNVGTLYYTTFLRDLYHFNKTPSLEITLITSSTAPFPVTITNKGGSFPTTTVTIDNTQLYRVNVTTNPWKGGTGFKIEGASAFTAHTLHTAARTSDGTLLFPIEALGTEYMILGLPYDGGQYLVYVFIVGTANGTSVSVTYSNGTTTTYTINEIDVIELKFHGDSTGTRISSTQPVAVITGHDALEYPFGCNSLDLAFDQLPPITAAGQQYALAPAKHGPVTYKPSCCSNSSYCKKFYEYFKVLAVEDGTTVTRTGSQTNETFTLNAGQFREMPTGADEYSYVVADKPIFVGHIMPCHDFANDEKSDPAFTILPPIEMYSKDYTAPSCSRLLPTPDHELTVIIETSQAASLLLNNQAFLGAAITNPIPSTSLSAYHYKISCPGSAQALRLTHSDSTVTYNAVIYGRDNFTAYVYLAGRAFAKAMTTTTSTTTTVSTSTSTTSSTLTTTVTTAAATSTPETTSSASTTIPITTSTSETTSTSAPAATTSGATTSASSTTTTSSTGSTSDATISTMASTFVATSTATTSSSGTSSAVVISSSQTSSSDATTMATISSEIPSFSTTTQMMPISSTVTTATSSSAALTTATSTLSSSSSSSTSAPVSIEISSSSTVTTPATDTTSDSSCTSTTGVPSTMLPSTAQKTQGTSVISHPGSSSFQTTSPMSSTSISLTNPPTTPVALTTSTAVIDGSTTVGGPSSTPSSGSTPSAASPVSTAVLPSMASSSYIPSAAVGSVSNSASSVSTIYIPSTTITLKSSTVASSSTSASASFAPAETSSSLAASTNFASTLESLSTETTTFLSTLPSVTIGETSTDIQLTSPTAAATFTTIDPASTQSTGDSIVPNETNTIASPPATSEFPLLTELGTLTATEELTSPTSNTNAQEATTDSVSSAIVDLISVLTAVTEGDQTETAASTSSAAEPSTSIDAAKPTKNVQISTGVSDLITVAMILGTEDSSAATSDAETADLGVSDPQPETPGLDSSTTISLSSRHAVRKTPALMGDVNNGRISGGISSVALTTSLQQSRMPYQPEATPLATSGADLLAEPSTGEGTTTKHGIKRKYTPATMPFVDNGKITATVAAEETNTAVEELRTETRRFGTTRATTETAPVLGTAIWLTPNSPSNPSLPSSSWYTTRRPRAQAPIGVIDNGRIPAETTAQNPLGSAIDSGQTQGSTDFTDTDSTATEVALNTPESSDSIPNGAGISMNAASFPVSEGSFSSPTTVKSGIKRKYTPALMGNIDVGRITAATAGTREIGLSTIAPSGTDAKVRSTEGTVDVFATEEATLPAMPTVTSSTKATLMVFTEELPTDQHEPVGNSPPPSANDPATAIPASSVTSAMTEPDGANTSSASNGSTLATRTDRLSPVDLPSRPSSSTDTSKMTISPIDTADQETLDPSALSPTDVSPVSSANAILTAVSPEQDIRRRITSAPTGSSSVENGNNPLGIPIINKSTSDSGDVSNTSTAHSPVAVAEIQSADTRRSLQATPPATPADPLFSMELSVSQVAPVNFTGSFVTPAKGRRPVATPALVSDALSEKPPADDNGPNGSDPALQLTLPPLLLPSGTVPGEPATQFFAQAAVSASFAWHQEKPELRTSLTSNPPVAGKAASSTDTDDSSVVLPTQPGLIPNPKSISQSAPFEIFPNERLVNSPQSRSSDAMLTPRTPSATSLGSEEREPFATVDSTHTALIFSHSAGPSSIRPPRDMPATPGFPNAEGSPGATTRATQGPLGSRLPFEASPAPGTVSDRPSYSSTSLEIVRTPKDQPDQQKPSQLEISDKPEAAPFSSSQDMTGFAPSSASPFDNSTRATKNEPLISYPRAGLSPQSFEILASEMPQTPSASGPRGPDAPNPAPNRTGSPGIPAATLGTDATLTINNGPLYNMSNRNAEDISPAPFVSAQPSSIPASAGDLTSPPSKAVAQSDSVLKQVIPNEEANSSDDDSFQGSFPQPSSLIGLLPWASEMEDALPYILNSFDLDQAFLDELGYQVDDFIFWCHYDGRQCQLKKETSTSFDPSYGNCFTFNPVPNTHFTRRGGQRLGLRMIFHQQSSDYLPFILPSGYKIALHEPEEQPIMVITGTTCSAGQYYAASVSKVTNTKLGDPYERCATNVTADAQHFYRNKTYTLETCLATCYQKYILKSCGCGDPRYPLPSGSLHCNLTKKPCVDEAAKKSMDTVSVSTCDCKPPCRSSVFAMTQTKAIWPSSQFIPPTCQEDSQISNLTKCRSDFKNAYSRLDVYYSVMTSTDMESYSQYSLSQLVSDAFANSGLWLNFCAISIFEIIVLPIIAILKI